MKKINNIITLVAKLLALRRVEVRLSIQLLFTVTVIMLCFNACRKDTICTDPTNPSCKNYDACYNKQNVKADFKIYELVKGIPFEADTVLISREIGFVCFNSNGATIKYTIKGNNSTITFSDTNKVINVCDVLHTGIVAGKMYTVTLVVKKDLGACGTYKSTDSLTKYFYMWPELQNNTVNGCTYNWLPGYTYPYNYYYRPICGTYIGTFKSNPTQTVVVTYQDTVMLMPTVSGNGIPSNCDQAFPPNHYERVSFLKNLPYNNWTSLNWRKYSDLYSSWCGASVALFDNTFYDPNIICNNSHSVPLNGYGILDINNANKVTFVYSYPDTLSGNWISDSFTGIRKN